MIDTRVSAAVAVSLSALCLAAPSAAQELSSLHVDFIAEARLLEAEIDDYFDTRESEQQALAELSRRSRQLDEILGDAHGSVSDLVRLESKVMAAREQAFGLSEESAEMRRRLYEGMKRLSAMARQLEQLGIGPVADGGVGGSWHVNASPNAVYGILDLEQDGTLLTGTFRLSNGVHGSIVGTFSSQRMELHLIDSKRGGVGSVRGELDSESGEIYGTWQARELAAGRPTAGHWTARRLSADTQEPEESIESIDQTPASNR